MALGNGGKSFEALEWQVMDLLNNKYLDDASTKNNVISMKSDKGCASSTYTKNPKFGQNFSSKAFKL